MLDVYLDVHIFWVYVLGGKGRRKGLRGERKRRRRREGERQTRMTGFFKKGISVSTAKKNSATELEGRKVSNCNSISLKDTLSPYQN